MSCSAPAVLGATFVPPLVLAGCAGRAGACGGGAGPCVPFGGGGTVAGVGVLPFPPFAWPPPLGLAPLPPVVPDAAGASLSRWRSVSLGATAAAAPFCRSWRRCSSQSAAFTSVHARRASALACVRIWLLPGRAAAATALRPAVRTARGAGERRAFALRPRVGPGGGPPDRNAAAAM